MGYPNISDLHFLEKGCGSGGVLTEFLSFGASPTNLCGVDLLIDQLNVSKECLPGSCFLNADIQQLSFPDHQYDLVLQFKAISSILDDDIRERICVDILRVLKLGGVLISDDFWLYPTNKQTRGLRPDEIRRLFPNCSYEFHKITLAPPITRRVVPVSWMVAIFVEKLTIFNSHNLMLIRPQLTFYFFRYS